MSNKENLLLRIKAVQVLDQLYYRKGEHLYSHHRVWRNHARRIFGINYYYCPLNFIEQHKN